jgi:hypothetical protein
MTGPDTRQRVLVWAPPQTIHDAIWTADLASRPLARALTAAAMIPERIGAWWRHAPAPPVRARSARLGDMLAEDSPWTLLEDGPGPRVTLGLLWHLPAGVRKVAPEAFEAFDAPGYAKVTWSIFVLPFGAGHGLLETETHTQTTDERTARRFALVWPVIKPFAAVLRRQVLLAIKAEAERTPVAASRPAVSRAPVRC